MLINGVFASNGGMVLKAYGISFLITTAGTACSLLLTIGLAYGLAKKKPAGQEYIHVPCCVYYAF